MRRALRIDRTNGHGSIGYWVAAHARRRHLAATAVGLLSVWAFDALQLARLELTCGTDNAASQRVAGQARFTREGVMRSHMPFKGVAGTLSCFSLLPNDPVLGRHLPAE
jgi:RimJ/RimL family protein N-acetyltransferase